MRYFLLIVVSACAIVSASTQFLAGPPQARPFEILGQKTGWVMLNGYKTPSFKIVTRSRRAQNRHLVKGDRIRLLMDLDLFVAGYWQGGSPNHGDPMISPATKFFGGDSASHAKIRTKTELLVEDVVLEPKPQAGTKVRILWARVSPLP